MDTETLLRGAPLVLLFSVLISFLGGFMVVFFRQAVSKPFLNSTVQQLRLADKVTLSHDTFRFRFELPSKSFHIGLPTGKHIRFFGPNHVGVKEGLWNDKQDVDLGKDQIQRKYTPVTGDEFPGFVDFVIKVYSPTSRFADGGKMSANAAAWKVGDLVDVMGPMGLLTYHGRGRLTHGKREYQKTKIGMVAGGSGITPILQVTRHILNDPEDSTEVWIIFANQTEEDIILRDVLEELQNLHPGRLHLWYTIDRVAPDQIWKYSVGFVSEAMLKEHLPPPSTDSLVLLCGPPPMIHQACRPNLTNLGWEVTDVLEF